MWSSKNADISKHFSVSQLIKYTIPTIVTVFVMSVYCIVDGFFISSYVGASAFAAVNTSFPLMNILASFGLLAANGGSAIIGNFLGQGKKKQANYTFSLVVYFCIAGGIVLSVIGFVLMEPLAILIGSEGEVLDITVYYGRISMISLWSYTFMLSTSVLFSTCGKPRIGFINSIISAVVIISLDAILVAGFGLGINGILIATISSELVGGIFPLVYFAKNKTSLLRLVSPAKVFTSKSIKKGWTIVKTCINGSSSFITEAAMQSVVLVTIFQINRYIGEQGVVSYGVIEYAWLIFSCIWIGFSSASAPLMSYQQGAKNSEEMQSLFKKGYGTIITTSVLCFALSLIFAPQLAYIFAWYDSEILELTINALRIYSIAFLFLGTSIYCSSLFASLGEGIIGAAISLIRVLVFELALLFILPMFYGGNGIWWAIAISEVITAVLCWIIVLIKGEKLQILKYNFTPDYLKF